MMNDVVFLFPDEGVAAERVERKTQRIVHPALVGVAAVAGVVHHVEADAGQREAERAAHQDADGGRQREKQEAQVQADGGGYQHDGLKIKVPVTRFLHVIRFKILFYRSLEGREEQRVLVVEGNFRHVVVGITAGVDRK